MKIRKKTQPQGSETKGKKKSLKLIIAAILVIAAIWLATVAGDILGWGFNGDRRVVVELPKGCTVAQMAEMLKEEGLISYPFVFRIYEKIDGEEHLFQQGGHILKKGMSYGEIIEKFTQKPDYAVNEAVKVTVPEGYEARQIAQRLEEMGLADSKKFMSELENGEFDFEFIGQIERKENRLEGYLFPATYDIMPGTSEHDIICKMLQAFEEKIIPIYNEAQTDYTLDEVVTFASMVEREAANDGERPIVASVFCNRMAADMTLSSCATIQYVLQERKPVLSYADTRIESAYNTYENKGLPVGPIASPGVNSVRAVLEPADTDYLYFAAKMDGSGNVFSKTGEEHERVVDELQGR